MEALRELVELVTRKRVKKVELFDEQSRNKNSNYYQLFEGIHTQKYDSDEAAAQDIYQCDASAKKYLILKTRLKQKLLNTLFFLDTNIQEHLSPREVALHECERALYHSKILLQNQSASIAIPIAEKTYKKAKEYQLTSIEYDCAQILARYHAEEKNYRDFVNFRNLSERLEKKRQAEDRAERYYLETITTYQKSKLSREAAREMAPAHIQHIREDLQKYKSQVLESYLLKLQTLHSQYENNYAATLKSLSEREQRLKQNTSLYAPEAHNILQLEKMVTFLHLKDYENGEKYYQTIHQIQDEGSTQWFALQELRLLLALHTQEYTAAAQVFKHSLEQSNFKNISDAEKEKWLVFQAYLHYSYRYQKQKEIRPLIQNTKLNFKLSEFVDDRPPFSKESRGLQVCMLAVQVLYYLERLDTEGAKDCIQALENYRRRYPKKDEYYRSECLIGMLLEMKEQDFRFYQTRKKTSKTFQELRSTSIESKNDPKLLEVFPFEFIWENILEKLKNFRYG